MSDQTAQPDTPAVLTLRGVSKQFDADGRTVEALKDVSFRADRGHITGLIGPDAAGKTTLMRLATGLLTPEAGEITVLDLDVATDPLAVQAAIGYMPQRFGLYEDLTVQENLDLYADLQGVDHADRPRRYEQLMHMTALADFTGRLAGKLSGGMKQKLGLACTLVRSPQLLLLDEPTVGVDPVSRRELWEIVQRLVRDEGTSVLLTTAYLDEAQRCDRVVMLHQGRLLDEGSPDRFEQDMRGRTFSVRPQGVKARRLQEPLAALEGVIDAVVQGDAVRVVTATTEPPDLSPLSGTFDTTMEPVDPRFEDSFVATLAKPGADGHSHEPLEIGHRVAAGDGTVIRVQDLSRKFGDFYAVKGISFEVQRGEIFGLLGANGAGKTTTFRMLCGLLPVSGGSLQVAGLDLRHAAAAARARVGYMSQKFSLYGTLSVAENLRFFSGAYGLRGRRRDDRVRWALDEFDLSSVARTRSAALPVGFAQRLAMACAILHEPEILFLDEPTSGVDPLARRGFWRRINALAEAGVTVMVTTHFMEEAEYCDRLAIMAAGEILTIGRPADIRADARTADHPEPTLEDAFIDLVKAHDSPEGQ